MTPNTTIAIQLTDQHGKQLEVENVSVDIVLYVQNQERYLFDMGVTNEKGFIQATYADLDGKRRGNQQFLFMDYNTLLDDCDEECSLVIPSIEQLEERLAVAEKHFPDAVTSLRSRVEQSKNAAVEAPCVVKVVTGGPAVTASLQTRLKS
jgi:hypothetical protein